MCSADLENAGYGPGKSFPFRLWLVNAVFAKF
jgi:hypothetical protein